MEGKKSKLYLKNGVDFDGLVPLWQVEPVKGEVVFTTGMTGYIETLTDPSFTDQIIVFTFPLIGNYGVPDQKDWESKKIHAAGVIVSEIAPHYSHFQAQSSLLEWLKSQNVPVMFGVDTRKLTKLIRTEGALLGTIGENAPEETASVPAVKKATISEPEEYGEGDKKIIVVDCGMKENILRHLRKYSLKIKRVPYDYDYSEEEFDGIFLSNGPGDPEACTQTISTLKKGMERKKPVFGICLGAQLMALAIGAKTYKLRYGHRGQNQPCQDVATNRCYLTSQNHGYAIHEESLPSNWLVNFRNLNDNTVEGIAHSSLPFFAVQFHPEAAPGPVDTAWLFDKFTEML